MDARGSHAVVLREGSITREQLADVAELAEGPVPAGVRSPGTTHPHYQPSARVVVADVGQGVAEANRHADRHAVGLLGPDDQGVDRRVRVLGTPIGAVELAAALYGALRTADDLGLDVVVVEGVPVEGLGRAVMDRLRRSAGAAAGSG